MRGFKRGIYWVLICVLSIGVWANEPEPSREQIIYLQSYVDNLEREVLVLRQLLEQQKYHTSSQDAELERIEFKRKQIIKVLENRDPGPPPKS